MVKTLKGGPTRIPRRPKKTEKKSEPVRTRWVVKKVTVDKHGESEELDKWLDAGLEPFAVYPHGYKGTVYRSSEATIWLRGMVEVKKDTMAELLEKMHPDSDDGDGGEETTTDVNYGIVQRRMREAGLK